MFMLLALQDLFYSFISNQVDFSLGEGSVKHSQSQTHPNTIRTTYTHCDSCDMIVAHQQRSQAPP